MSGFQVGQRASRTRTFGKLEVQEFLELAGQPKSGAEEVVPPGILGGMFSDLLGTRLPGRGTNWLKQSLEFPAPARVGEPLTATVEIVRVRPEKSLINLSTICRDAQGVVVCRGEALVLVKEHEEVLNR
ncbi:MAG: phosphate acetyltransferase [Myxococcota bacterium]